MRQRTADLAESLQQQTTTADGLKIINRSAFDLKAVLQTLVESSARLCDADKGTITRQIDGVFYRAESYGFPAELMERWRNVPLTPERGSVSGRALLEGRTVHIPDVDTDPDFTFDRVGMRSVLGVPMLREGVPIGVLGFARSDVRPFTDKQIDLVSTFADQAVIAIETRGFRGEQRARTSLPRRWSSRWRPRKCSRLSAARLLISRWCWIHCCGQPEARVKLIWGSLRDVKMANFIRTASVWASQKISVS